MAKKASASSPKSLFDRLWRIPVYLPYVQSPLTDRAIRSAEKRLGVRLPKAYLDALRLQNGGYLRRFEHPSGRAPVDALAGIGPRYPSLLERDWAPYKEHMREQGITTPTRIDDLIAFCGDGHYFYCLDYRKCGRRGEPRVTYIDVECFNVDEVVAPNFSSFLRTLKAPPSTAIGLLTAAAAKRVATALSVATGIELVDLGDRDHGYRQFRASLRGKGGWVWLSANRARRGFVRRGEKDYAKLRRRMPEIVERYPEHAECGYFLELSDPTSKAARAVIARLAKLPFGHRSVVLE
jgi:hypothetical protein